MTRAILCVVYCKGWMYTEMQDVHKEMCDSCNFVCGVLQGMDVYRDARCTQGDV